MDDKRRLTMGKRWSFGGKIRESCRYHLHLIVAQFGIHRQRKNLSRRTLGLRQASGSIAQIRISRLQMDGFGVVD